MALACQYRDQERMSVAEIAHRLGRAQASIKAYLYYPTGEKVRAVKRRYQSVCRGCGAPIQARKGKGDAYEYCKRCYSGATARKVTRERVRNAMRAWQDRHGTPSSSTDWSRTHAGRRNGQGLKRLEDRDWPAPST